LVLKSFIGYILQCFGNFSFLILPFSGLAEELIGFVFGFFQIDIAHALRYNPRDLAIIKNEFSFIKKSEGIGISIL